MHDMLVKLYELPEKKIKGDSPYVIRRAMAPDREEILDWVKENVGRHAAGECAAAFANSPVSCYIATAGGEIVGFACYDATAPDFFGPMEVDEKWQGKGIGRELLLACLYSMREKGYGYAIIGGVGPAEFYQKNCGAVTIEGSDPGIYRDFLPIIRRQREKTPE